MQTLKNVASWKRRMTYSMSMMTKSIASMENVFDQEPFGTLAEGKQKEKAEAPMQNDGSDLDDDEDEKESEKEEEGVDHLVKERVANENAEPS